MPSRHRPHETPRAGPPRDGRRARSPPRGGLRDRPRGRQGWRSRISATAPPRSGSTSRATRTTSPPPTPRSRHLIRRRLAEAFPADTFFGEEGGGAWSDRVWVVDPVDGTANFMRGIPAFCISIAFVRDGRTEVGVIYDPLGDELFAAARGRGATSTARRCG